MLDFCNSTVLVLISARENWDSEMKLKLMSYKKNPAVSTPNHIISPDLLQPSGRQMMVDLLPLTKTGIFLNFYLVLLSVMSISYFIIHLTLPIMQARYYCYPYKTKALRKLMICPWLHY